MFNFLKPKQGKVGTARQGATIVDIDTATVVILAYSVRAFFLFLDDGVYSFVFNGVEYSIAEQDIIFD